MVHKVHNSGNNDTSRDQRSSGRNFACDCESGRPRRGETESTSVQRRRILTFSSLYQIICLSELLTSSASFVRLEI